MTEPKAAPSGLIEVIDGTGTEVLPIPDKPTICGLPEVPSRMVKVPDRMPCTVGVNVTLIEQVARAAMLKPQLLVCAKFSVVAMLLTAIAPFVLFLRVTLDALVVPTI
jgi:hypothetical protein